MASKLSKLIGIRLSEADRKRVDAICARTGMEPVDLIRDAALEELDRMERAAALDELQRLRRAGIDLKALVDYALARKALEDAQAGLPGIFNGGGGR